MVEELNIQASYEEKALEEVPSVEAITSEIEAWIKNIVIGLHLCPFAEAPLHKQQIRIYVSMADTGEAVLQELQNEFLLLDRTPPDDLETTLLVIPRQFSFFEDYNDFLYLVDLLIEHFHWKGIFQVASFHPNYCFAGNQPDDPENLTNRSPYPILHLLREDSISRAIASHPDPSQIPNRNIQTIQNLTSLQKQLLFSYLRLND